MKLFEYHLKIRGRVQGVAFRAYTQQKALALGLTGWVKNCEDGSVEIVAVGEERILDQFKQWCYQGSPQAQVTHVEVLRVREVGVVGHQARFEILRR